MPVVFAFEDLRNLLFQEESMVFSGGVDSKIVQFRQITNKVTANVILPLFHHSVSSIVNFQFYESTN